VFDSISFILFIFDSIRGRERIEKKRREEKREKNQTKIAKNDNNVVQSHIAIVHFLVATLKTRAVYPPHTCTQSAINNSNNNNKENGSE
jgi:hypothetical protein